MKNNILFLLSCICLMPLFCSCERNVELPSADQKTTEAAEARLYYYYGLKPGMTVIAVDSFYLNTAPKSEFSGKKEFITYKGIKNFEMAVDDYRGSRIYVGDSLQIVGGFERNILKNGKEQDCISVRKITDGTPGGEQWNIHGIVHMAPTESSWTSIFSSNATERMENIGSLILIALMVLAVYYVWLLIYWLIVSKIKGDECFWKYERIVSRPLFYLASILIGFLYFLIDFSESLTYSLRFNPDIFVTWSEQPLCVKMIPFVAAIWFVLAIIMLVEMIIKLRTIWLIIYYPGKIAIGLLIVAAVIMASWLIYIIFPTIIAFVWVSLFGKADDYTGGELSGRNKRTEYLGTHTKIVEK